MLTFGSLFAGIGGFDLGLERAGMKCLWQVEIDPWCRKVLAKHWPDVERFEDVREVGRHNLRAVDLVCGGFPCQPVSCAGQRKGTDDERWLWPEFARVVREIRPRWVLGENVPGLLSIDAGRLFGGVLRDLAACGYVVEWDCIPAAAVGAPHKRDRVFIVAHTTSDLRRTSGHEVRETSDGTSVDVADATLVFGYGRDNNGLGGPGSLSQPGNGCEETRPERSRWPVESGFCRVADGVPKRIHRLRGLGNAVVPQVAEWIGRRIVDAAGETKP